MDGREISPRPSEGGESRGSGGKERRKEEYKRQRIGPGYYGEKEEENDALLLAEKSAEASLQVSLHGEWAEKKDQRSLNLVSTVGKLRAEAMLLEKQRAARNGRMSLPGSYRARREFGGLGTGREKESCWPFFENPNKRINKTNLFNVSEGACPCGEGTHCQQR